MLIGDFDAADTESPLGPLKDKTESVSVNPVESSKNHAYIMPRMNSENISNFFVCLDILFLTYSNESMHLEVKHNTGFFSNILKFSRFFDFCEFFRLKLLRTATQKCFNVKKFAMKFHIEMSICSQESD